MVPAPAPEQRGLCGSCGDWAVPNMGGEGAACQHEFLHPESFFGAYSGDEEPEMHETKARVPPGLSCFTCTKGGCSEE